MQRPIQRGRRDLERVNRDVRRLVTLLVLLAVLVGSVLAQSNEATSAPSSTSRSTKVAKPSTQAKSTKPPKVAPSDEGLFARAMTWARKSTYAAAKGGRAYAEGLVRKSPKTFASIQNEVSGLAKRVTKNGALRDLDEKRRYVAELWRLRASLDLMALLDAHTLQMLTGIDAKMIETLQRTLGGAAKALGLAPAQTRPVTKRSAKG